MNNSEWMWVFGFAFLVGVVLFSMVTMFASTKVKIECTFTDITWDDDKNCSFMGGDGCPQPKNAYCKIESPMIYLPQLK